MIQEVFDSMIALLLTKFLLNDVPHAAGLEQNLGWVTSAWARTCAYAKGHGINLQSAYDRFVAVQPQIDREYLSQKALVPRILPPRVKRARDTKTLLAGYWLIACDEATDRVVDDVHSLLLFYRNVSEKAYVELLGMTYVEMGEESADLAIEEFLPTLNLIQTAITRADKVIAIDSFMQYSHLGYASEVEAWSIAEMFVLDDEEEEPYFKAIWGVLNALAGASR